MDGAATGASPGVPDPRTQKPDEAIIRVGWPASPTRDGPPTPTAPWRQQPTPRRLSALCTKKICSLQDPSSEFCPISPFVPIHVERGIGALKHRTQS
jgi:hypothetical protein